MSNYLVQFRHTYETEWTPHLFNKWGRKGHLTYPGAWLHKMYLKRRYDGEPVEIRIHAL